MSLKHVLIEEVSLRDGLQNETKIVLPQVRAHLVNKLQNAGIKRIQIGSFVNPKLVPQMAGTDEVWHAIRRRQDVRYNVLVLSKKGLKKAIDEGIPHVSIYFSASDTHSRNNVGLSANDARELAIALMRDARKNGLTSTLGIMCAFGYNSKEPIKTADIKGLVSKLPLDDVEELSLADTVGQAIPKTMKQTLREISALIDPERLCIHLHDTKGLGYENLQIALEFGVSKFDTSLTGLGGCPFVPGAVGNISTEKTISLLEKKGITTGIDIEELDKIATELKQILL